jgi:hypothetical protein
MEYLQGEKIKIDAPTLRKMVGVKVKYLLKRDIDKSGRGYFFPNYGTIAEVKGNNVDLGNGCLESFSSIKEIVLL